MANTSFGETVLDPAFNFGRKLLDHTFALADIGTDMAKKLGDQQAQIGGAVVDFGLRQFDLLPALRDGEDYLVKQAAAGKALRDQSLQYVGVIGEIFKDAGTRSAESVRTLVQEPAEAAA